MDGHLDLDGQPEGALVEHVDKMLLNSAIITFQTTDKLFTEMARPNSNLNDTQAALYKYTYKPSILFCDCDL